MSYKIVTFGFYLGFLLLSANGFSHEAKAYDISWTCSNSSEEDLEICEASKVIMSPCMCLGLTGLHALGCTYIHMTSKPTSFGVGFEATSVELVTETTENCTEAVLQPGGKIGCTYNFTHFEIATASNSENIFKDGICVKNGTGVALNIPYKSKGAGSGRRNDH